MAIFNLVYTSRLTQEWVNIDLDSILTAAREKNRANGLCGALLVAEGRFVQVLEGERDAVMATFERISLDNRHEDIELLCAQTVTKPRFSEWSMAFVGDTPDLRDRFAGEPLADLAVRRSGDPLLDFMREIAREPMEN